MLVLILLLITIFTGSLHAQNPVTVLEGGTLIDGTGRAPISDAVVVIENSRIRAVGARGQVSYPANAKIIKTDGKFILPGLLDAHMHLRDYMPQMMLRYGVTTMGDTNNHTDWILLEREALRTGKIKGPRMYVSGTASAGPDAEMTANSHRLRNVDEARAYVKGLVAQGVDMIKVDLNLTIPQLRAITEEAAKAGLPVVGHSQNIQKAAEAGLKYMEHTDTLGRAILEQMGGPEKVREGGSNPERLMDTSLFDPLIQSMVKQGVFINPTLLARWRTSTPHAQEWANEAKEIIKDPALAFVPPAERQLWAEVEGGVRDAEGYRKVQEFIRKYVQAGGKLVSSTDKGSGAFVPGLGVHYEMEMAAEAGVPPMQVLQSVTLWAAESIGQGKDVGSVEPGKFADFTVIDANPLADIKATRKISMVIKGGEVVDTAYDPKFVNPLPRPAVPGRDGDTVNVIPQLTTMTPRVAPQGSPDVMLQIEGLGFGPKSVVRFDNVDLPTRFVNSRKLTAMIDSRLVRNIGTYAVYVVNPGTGGSVSDVIQFFVNFKN